MSLLAVTNQSVVLVVIFWVLYILAAILSYLPAPSSTWDRPSRAVLFILIGILGYATFGSPF